jgi:5'-3' exoribonuclease 2
VTNVRFRDPKYANDYIFPARVLANAQEPPKVLKQGVDEGNPNYRPVIGFNQNRSQFASLGDSGKRFINHHSSNRYFEGGNNGEFYYFIHSKHSKSLIATSTTQNVIDFW